MSQPTIVLFGTVQHPALNILYHYLQERANRRVVFLANEAFPHQPGFDYELDMDGEGGRFILPEPDQEPVEFRDIVSLGLDGYYVAPEGLENYSDTDREYLQTESWAALIAIFAGLARHCRVANHILQRDHLSSRIAMLAYLRSSGLQVPEVCVTSDGEAARTFIARHAQVLHRPIAVRDLPLRPLTEEDEPRLAALPLCPVHFEEHVPGELASVIRVGDQLWRQQDLPEDTLEAVHRAANGLALEIAEFTFRKKNGHWVCTNLQPFFNAELMADADAAAHIAEYFEA